MTTQRRTLRGVLLDVDGTLVNSNDAHARSWVEALVENGYDVPFERVRPLIGMGGDKVLPETIGVEKDSEVGKKISQRRKEIMKTRYIKTVQSFPGTLDLLQHMHAQGLKLILATSAEPDELQAELQRIDPQASSLFENAASSKDVQESKPDPDVINAAIKKSGLAPDELIMLGDTAYDIESAGKADVAAIALLCGGWSRQDLRQAIAIYDDPADLLAHYDESPLGSFSTLKRAVKAPSPDHF